MFNTKKNKKVFVAMSGGVDSSVAALLLKKQGYDVTGIFMRNWHEEMDGKVNSFEKSDPVKSDTSDRGTHSKTGFSSDCTWEEDQEDVRRVCAQLDIPFYTWDFSEDYYRDVVEYFFAEYEAGRTPNPDVMCNKYIKFGKFYERARALGADFVATGHYVRRKRKLGFVAPKTHPTPSGHPSQEGNNTTLFSQFKNPFSFLHTSYSFAEGVDPNKDQTYFLWAITEEQVKHSLFPIGKYHKPKIREIAAKAGLSTAKKPDSQGICFIGRVNVRDFLKTRLDEKPGDIVTVDGDVVGQHNGLYFYTEGQREGIGVGGTKEPYYVARRDFKKNELIVVEGADNPELFSSSLTCSQVHWIAGDEPKFPLNCLARIRYHQGPQHCVVQKEGENLKVAFKNTQRAVSAGQSIVFYQRDICLGGAIIDSYEK